MALDRDRPPPRGALRGRALLASTLAAGGVWSLVALVTASAHRVPLGMLWGAGIWLLMTALATSALLGGLALWRLLGPGARVSRTTPPGWGRDLFCLLALGAVAYLAFAQPFASLTSGFGLALCAGAFSARVIAGTPAKSSTEVRTDDGPRRRRRPRGRLSLALFSVCALLVVAECGLRVYGALWPSPLLSPTNAGVVERIETHRPPAGQLRWGFPTNAGGHYDEPFLPRAERTRTTVAMLGDSFSAGIVPFPFHFTAVMERQLDGVRIDNFGVGAMGPVHYEHMLRTEVLPHEPDAIVLNLFVGNDLTRHLEVRGGVLQSWLDRDNVRLVLLPRRLAALRQEPADGDAGTTAGEAGVATPQGESDTDDLTADWDGDLDALGRRFPWAADHRLERPTFSREQFLEVELGRAESVCGAEVEGYPGLLAVLDRMRDACGSIPFAVVLIPDEFQVEDALWDELLARSADTLDRDKPQRLLVAALAERGVPVLDLLPALRAEPPEADGSRHLYHLHDTHFNARGNRVAGEAMARFLVDEGLAR